MSDDQELYLIDASGYIFRAYYAMAYRGGTALTNPDGVPVGAVYGFTTMVMKLLREHPHAKVAVIFDAGRETFRHDIYPEYKANRDETPEDLIPQFPMVREATEAFGLPMIELAGYEADDLIATYARQASAKGMTVKIVSSDKDLMQLVDDNICLLDPMKNKIIDAAGVVEKFGVTPDKVIDVQALAGDSTDNVPGVPSIGIKTAAQLINEYGSLEMLLTQLESIKQPKRRQVLTDHAEDARISMQLVRLVDDAPVPIKLEDIHPYDPDHPHLKDFLEQQGFQSLLSRIGAISDAPQKEKPKQAAPFDRDAYVLIDDLATLKEWVESIKDAGLCAVDTETTHLTPMKADLVGISICYAAGKAGYIPLTHKNPQADLLGDAKQDIKQIALSEVIALLKPILEDPSILKIAHNAKYDWQLFKKHDVTLSPIDDTMLMSYVLDGTSQSNSMDALSEKWLDHKPMKYEEVAGKGKSQVTFDYVSLEQAVAYAAEDADVTFRLYGLLKPRIAKEKMAFVYEEIERKLIPVIAQMEMDGIRVDPVILKKMSDDFAQKLTLLEEKIHTQAGTPFNIGSPKQIGEILFGQMEIKGGKKTKTGQWSTDVTTLEKLSDAHPIVSDILEWRGLSKLKSTYTDALPHEICAQTGRVHTSFSMAGTSTGRLASSDPNLQNIPIRTEEGRKIREAFVASDGNQLVSVDYSQVELRLAAQMAGIEALKKAFQDGVDIHALTASRVFDVPLEDVTPDLRRSAKAVNFGIIYGISGWGLAKQLGCPADEAHDFIQRYLNAFHELRAFMEAQKAYAHEHEFVKTWHGRKCFTPNINAKQKNIQMGAERAAINAPLQGTAADIMKLAMIAMPAALAQAGLSAKMLLQVHDELIFDVPNDELDQTKDIVRHVMETIVDFDVPLIAEAGHGESWAQAH